MFFGGRTTPWSERISCWIGNSAVVFGLAVLLTQVLLYRWTGRLYPEGEGYRLDTLFGGLDNRIPFIPQTALLYLYLYYAWKFVTLLYFSFIEYRRGYAIGVSLLFIGLFSIVVYILFPVSVYWWRLELLADPLEGSFLAERMYRYYETDTSFNCFPSLHAANSTVIALAWWWYRRERQVLWTKVVSFGSVLMAAGVVLSTLFVKQHYIADEIAGIVLALLIACFVFRWLWDREYESAT
jgi:membrane-associated phospholipid phosphatase